MPWKPLFVPQYWLCLVVLAPLARSLAVFPPLYSPSLLCHHHPQSSAPKSLPVSFCFLKKVDVVCIYVHSCFWMSMRAQCMCIWVWYEYVVYVYMYDLWDVYMCTYVYIHVCVFICVHIGGPKLVSEIIVNHSSILFIEAFIHLFIRSITQTQSSPAQLVS